MRVLFVSQIVPYPPHGGVLQRGFNLLREIGREHEVRLLAFHHLDELPEQRVPESISALRDFCADVEYFSMWPKQSRLHKIASFVAALPYVRPYSVLTHRSAALANRIREICEIERWPDIVHLDTIALAPYRAQCLGLPCVLTHHNVESQLMERRAGIERLLAARAYVALQARRLRRYEKNVCPTFPVNVTVSEDDAQTLRTIAGPVRTVVVPNGVDTVYFKPIDSGRQSNSVIYTGGMQMFANRDAVEWFLKEVWPLVRRRVPDARFVAIGAHPPSWLVKAAAANIGVIAPGFVDDIRPWVSDAAVYIVPLRVGGGTRLKMVDAMAQGKAIVATDIGAEGIKGQSGVHYLLRNRSDDFAEAIVGLMSSREMRAELGAKARQLAETVYSWPVVARTLIEAYQGLASDSQDRANPRSSRH